MNWIKWLSVICSIVCIICLLWAFICEVASNEWIICLGKGGVKNAVTFWAEYSGLWKLLFASATIFVAVVNLKKFIDTGIINSLSELRTKLNSDRNFIIHSYLLIEDDKAPIDKELINYFNEHCNEQKIIKKYDEGMVNAALFDYLGTLELGVIMFERGLMDMEEFENQFKYRYEAIFNNKSIKAHIESNTNYYKYLLRGKSYFDI